MCRWATLCVLFSCIAALSAEKAMQPPQDVAVELQTDIYRLATTKLLAQVIADSSRWEGFNNTEALHNSIYVTPCSEETLQLHTTPNHLVSNMVWEIVTYTLANDSKWRDSTVPHCWEYAVGKLIYVPFSEAFTNEVDDVVENILLNFRRDAWIYAHVDSYIRLPHVPADSSTPHWLAYNWRSEILYNTGHPEQSYVILSVER